MTSETPTPGELYRRLLILEQGQLDGFDKIHKRLDGFPTEQTLLALLQVKDSQIESINSQIRHVTNALASEREERIRADREIEAESTSAKRWAITTLVGGIGVFVAFVSLLLSLSGNPTA